MQSLKEYIESSPVISTHEHHQPFPPAQEASLEWLFTAGYVGWCGVEIKSTSDRSRFLDLLAGNSYFVWYEKALDDLFDFGGRITTSNWDSISEKVREAFARRDFHEGVFRDRMRCEMAIIDCYWDPGSDNGRPDLYAPTFRINSFLYGNSLESRDHNGNNAQLLYGRCEYLDEYLEMIDRVIAEKKAAGCVALKSALAYDRSLDFRPQSKRTAERVFGKPADNVAPEELKAFGNYVFDYICMLAAKHDLPLQNHTGLGRLYGSNPMNLIPMIEKHPDTKFVLFHGGYPWTEEVVALSHNYSNVYVDLCWLPTICTSAAERTLHSLIEAARDSSRVTWGGDCWWVTESYAQLLAMRTVLGRVLTQKVESGYLTPERAKRLVDRILRENAAELYGLGQKRRASGQRKRADGPRTDTKTEHGGGRKKC